jgi:hypothetical protein
MSIHVSPSQIKTFRRCKRLHWLQKVAQVPTDKVKTGAERGKSLHKVVETYLEVRPEIVGESVLEFAQRVGLYEDDLRFGLRSFELNREYINIRETFHKGGDLRLLIEQEFKIGSLFVGVIDLVCVKNDATTAKPFVSIRDHKFLADKRYIPTLEDLLEDPQTIMYCTAVLDFFGLDRIEMVYDYYGTKSKWYEPRKICLTADELHGKWRVLKDETLGILDNYLLEDSSETEANYLSCQMYGGCDYKNICFGESK